MSVCGAHSIKGYPTVDLSSHSPWLAAHLRHVLSRRPCQVQRPHGHPWALVALKDGDSKVPTASLYGTPTSTREHLKQWLVANRLPGVLELTQDTFQTVMNAPHSPLVVIAASNGKLQGKIQEKKGELAKIWKVKTGGSGRVDGRQVVFTWMDAKRWKEWMKSMYGIKVDDDDDDLEDVKVIVANHKYFVYYDQDLSGCSFKLTARDRIFKSLEDMVSGMLGYRNSENLIERFARSLNAKMVSLEQYIVEYPYRFVFFLIVMLGVVFWGLYRWIGDDASRLEGIMSISKPRLGGLTSWCIGM